jgi:hypothetical protein
MRMERPRRSGLRARWRLDCVRSGKEDAVQILTLTPPRLAFIIGTRVALAAGLGLLLAGRLPDRARRRVGIGLVALGAITTYPAIRAIVAAA